MNARILPPEEWPRLVGTEAEAAWPYFNPEHTKILVVEEDGEIIGTWTAVQVVHAECIWVAPSHRGSFGVWKRLLRGMRDMATAWGANRVLTASASPEVTNLILKWGGVPVPCETFVLQIAAQPEPKARLTPRDVPPSIGVPSHRRQPS